MLLYRNIAWNIVLVLLGFEISQTLEAKTERSHKPIAEFKRLDPCPSTGKRRGPCPGWQIDHIKPLKCNGDDAPHNMQWLTVEDHKRKTAREARLCRK